MGGRKQHLPPIDPVTHDRVSCVDYERVDATMTNKRRRGSGLTSATVQNLLRQGLTGEQIAKRYGVTRARVSQLKRQTDAWTRTAFDEAEEYWPLLVPDRFHSCRPYKNLRSHGAYTVDSDSLNEGSLKLLRGFYAHLTDFHLVVEYDPDIPPQRRIATGGFAYRTRQETDGDLMIRPNEHTHGLDRATMQDFWRLPPESSWP